MEKIVIMEKIYKETFRLFVGSEVLGEVETFLEHFESLGKISLIDEFVAPWGDVEFTFNADDWDAEDLEYVLKKYC